jgi:hypothetical protein
VFEDGASRCRRSELHYAPRPEHLNSFDVTHGGACMTLLDVVMATAARSVQPGHGRGHHRDEDQLHAPGQGHARRPLTAKGRLMHRTKPWPSPKARSMTKPAGLRACHRHLQVRERAPDRATGPESFTRRFQPTETRK